MYKFPTSSSYFLLLQEEEATQVMELSSVMLPNAEGSEAREAESSHLNEMSLTTPPSEDQDIAGNMHQETRDPLDDTIDEVQQRLVAPDADNSPSKSSTASFKTAREQTSPTKPSEKALGKRKEENTPRKPDPVDLPPPGSIRQSTTITQTSSRPTTSHRASTTHSSTAATSQVPSTSSSKRSARRGHRRSNTTWPPQAPTSIPNPKQALQSLQTFSSLRDDVLSGMQAEERQKLSSSLPTLPRPKTANKTTAASSSTIPHDASSPIETPHPPAIEYSNHVPAANLDWTHPSTRRREYEKIDKAHRGIRGLMRRVTPRCLLKNGRVGFHNDDGKGSDAGTVRRFRMDVGDGDGDRDSVVDVEEEEEEEEEGGAKSKWWKSIGKKMMGKGKGKGKKGESSTEGGMEGGE